MSTTGRAAGEEVSEWEGVMGGHGAPGALYPGGERVCSGGGIACHIGVGDRGAGCRGKEGLYWHHHGNCLGVPRGRLHACYIHLKGDTRENMAIHCLIRGFTKKGESVL